MSSDMVTDNRVHKIASALVSDRYNVKVLSRKFSNSTNISGRPYFIKRYRLWFNRGPFFYANMNIRYFLYLLFTGCDIILSNDLDTLPACWLASAIKNKKLVFDSHELFPEVPELVDRPGVRKIWQLLEKFLVKRIDRGITVCRPIASYYANKYGKNFEVIRNAAPVIADFPEVEKDKKVIIYQGVLNVGRGLELAINSMRFTHGVILQIIGEGDIRKDLHRLVSDLGLEQKVVFSGRLPIEKLRIHTIHASIGISLEEDLGLNYRYALPNKLFDYIQARIPVVVSDLPEMSSLVEKYGIGKVLKKRDPESLASLFSGMLDEEVPAGKYSKNLEKAAAELSWENEKEKLRGIFSPTL